MPVTVRSVARDPRLFAAVLAAWVALWILGAVIVYRVVAQLEDYGDTTVTASRGLVQTSQGLTRAAAGLRNTGNALDEIPFVGGGIAGDVDRTARDVEQIARTVRVTARQARVNGEQTRDSAGDIALVLAAAVAIVPTLPVLALALALRPVLARTAPA